MQGPFSLGRLLEALFRRWKILVFGTLAVAVLAAVIALVLPPKFMSGATILPEQEDSASPLAALLGQAGLPLAGSLLGQSASSEIHREILLSYTLAQRVVEGLDLYGPFDLEEARVEDPVGAEQSAVAKLREGLSVEIIPPSQVLLLLVETSDPVLSRDVAARYIEELERFKREQNQESGRRKRIFLETRHQRTQADLAAARKELEEFSARHGVVHLPTELEGELALVAELNRRLVLKELERAGLAQDATSASPALKRVDAEILVLRDKLAELSEGSAESSLRFTALSELPALALEYFRLQTELRIQQELSGLLVQQLEQAKLQEANDVSTLKILDPPLTPTLPSAPPKKLIVLAAAFLGFFCLLVLVLISEFYRRVREDADGELSAWHWLPGGRKNDTQ